MSLLVNCHKYYSLLRACVRACRAESQIIEMTVFQFATQKLRSAIYRFTVIVVVIKFCNYYYQICYFYDYHYGGCLHYMQHWK